MNDPRVRLLVPQGPRAAHAGWFPGARRCLQRRALLSFAALALLAQSTCRTASGETPPETSAALLRSAWESARAQGEGFPPEVTTWRFQADGSFRRSTVSDHDAESAGAWLLERGEGGQGMLLCAAAGPDGAISRRDALSLRFADTTLRLGEQDYAARTADASRPPALPPALRDALRPERRQASFQPWSLLIGSWRSREAAAPGLSTAYAFADDGRYTARGPAADCEYAGTWSLLGLQESTAELRMSVPAHRCDPRGPREAHVESYPIEVLADRLRIHQRDYARATTR